MRKITLLIAFLFSLTLVEAQQKEITGHVIDESGKPIPGVSVTVKGQKNGTTTDDNGAFKIMVNTPNARIIFTYVGYSPNETSPEEASSVVMKLRTQTADSVVVVGYGTLKKVDVTGSVVTVKSSELLAQPISNALEGLQGRVSGLDISLNSGAPGGLASVIIRGIGSINSSTDPLYVVDGVAMVNIQFLNPYDIQSVEVLKDASATSIYGARGANGVILVTTKRGATSNGTVVSYDGYISFGHLEKEISVLSSKQWLGVLAGGMANNSIWGAPPRSLDLSDTRLFNADGSPIYNTDWQKASTRNAVSTSHELSIQTKNDKSSTGIFLNYTNNEGIMLNSALERYNLRFAHDLKVTNWLDFGINALINYTKEHVVDPTTGANTPTRTMIEMPSIFPVKFPDGSWANNQVSSTFSFLDAAENPAKVLEEQTHVVTRTQIFGNAFLNFHITKDLDFKTQFGVDFQDSLYDFYSPTDLLNISANQKGVASITSEQYRYWQWENYLTYKKNFGIHHLNVVAGASWQERVTTNVNGSTQYFSDDYYRQYNLGAGAQPNSPTSAYDRWAINSYFARISYNMLEKYLLTFSGRVDGSSRFGADNKYAFFPSVGLGWIVSKEDFMTSLSAINYLKIRASYGQTGNTEIGSYQSLATISSGTTLINGARAGSSSINGLPNPDLQWEKTAQTDVGLELQMFNSRISLEFDYYYKKTSNLLLNKPIPQSTGFDGVLSNIGSLSNQGEDISLTTKNVEGRNFSWVTTFTVSHNQNKVLSLGSNNEDIFPGPYWGPVSDGFTILRVGQPAGSFWGYQRLGTWSVEDVAKEIALDPNFSHKPGEEKESATKQIIGKNTPDWYGSFVNTFRYKNFDLLVDLQFSQGADIVQAFLFSSEDRTGYSNSLSTVLNAWTPANQNTPIQQLRFAPDAGQSASFDSHWVADGSFIRGRNVVLGYNFDQITLNRLKFKKLRIYLSAQNLFLITSSSYHGYDPQSISWNTPGAPPFGQNIEFYQYPKARTFTGGISLSF